MKLILILLTTLIIFILFKIFIYYRLRKKKEKIKIHLQANVFIESINKLIEFHKYNLLEERRRLKKIDAYGNENLSRWIGNLPLNKLEIQRNIVEGSSKFNEGIPYFWLNVLLKDFGNTDSFFTKWDSYRTVNPLIEDEIYGIRRQLKKEDWYVFIASLIEKCCLNISKDNAPQNKFNNYKKGINFEYECKKILNEKGWEVEETSSTGDQGVDLIASIENFRLCIQCKNHKKPIGNRAVQEISAGKTYWKGTHAILISKSGFTNSAFKLAEANNIILISYDKLNSIEDFLFDGRL